MEWKSQIAAAAGLLLAGTVCTAQTEKLFGSADGLVMAGYQGWFNAEGDGTGMGWKHYQKGRTFAPGSCTIDLWPDVSEYEKTYPTPFTFEDGTPAEVFSSHDKSTTDLHFRWMQEYGLDGVYVQRFVTSIRGGKNRDNKNDILRNCLDAAEKYGRAICVMYDLSGMKPEDVEVLKSDWMFLKDEMKVTDSSNYLWHNGKPLVAVWGAGFNDNRKYSSREVGEILDFLSAQGCSLLLGVPAHWRSGKMDAVADPELLELVEKVDIVH
ncbi:MAG: xylosidase, partial [Candidatus Cryptobacteroides sp.]